MSESSSPLSLERLTSAFSAMLGRKVGDAQRGDAPSRQEAEISTRSITEALLFVGQPDNRPFSVDQLAVTMRDVSPDEVAEAVRELNSEYAEDEAAFHIEETSAGYRLVLRPELDRVRQNFSGKVRRSTLSPTAIEVLSIIAYRQPVAVAEIDELRGTKSQPLVAQLVRRGLVRLERSQGEGPPNYSTTDRFLEIFHLKSLDDLPQAAEFATR